MAKAVVVASIHPKTLALAVAMALMPLSQAGRAQVASSTLPSGGQVTSGAATLSYSDNKLQIDQATGRAIINWDSFSIGSVAWVNFSQPSASAVALNRVLGGNPSEIFGRLTANGQVFLTNPNGMLFARGASVEVGGLFATTLSIADKDFLAGRYNFYNAGGAGSVVNQGNIITANGYAALAGPQVSNDGVIVARAGTVALAAGDRVTLDLVGDGLIKVSVDQAALNASAINTGRIEADGGNVILTARSANALLDTVVNNSGIIRANSLIERNGDIVLDGGSAGVVTNTGTLQAAGVDAGTTGGSISVLGDKVGVSGQAVIDASGDSGGGTVTIGRGASATVIGADTVIRADATREGQGGFVETSGARLEVNSAPQIGAGGTWLIDPYNIEIVAGTGAVNNTGPTTFTPVGDNSQIGAALIGNQLNAGTNVVVDTGTVGAQAGDISVSAPISKTVANASSLTFNAAHDVLVNQNITMASGLIAVNASGLTNNAAISTTGGNTILTADRFSLSSGTINGGNGAVILRPRNPLNSFGIESAGATTVTNADIASITTSDFLVFGSGTAGIANGSVTIGANRQVDGGTKNLAFFRSPNVSGSTTLGAGGVATSGNVIISAGAGALTGTGTVTGNQVQLRATTGIGSAGARINTAANTLAINNAGPGGAFVAEADSVTLGSVNLTVGGNVNNVSNLVAAGAYDVKASGAITATANVTSNGTMTLDAGAAAINLNASGAQDVRVTAVGGQTIKAGSLGLNAQNSRAAVISNTGGNQTVDIGAGGINLNVVNAQGVAQIVNTRGGGGLTNGTQTVKTTGALNVLGGVGVGGNVNSGIFQQQTGKQAINAGSILLQAANSPLNNAGALILNTSTGGLPAGDQEINVNGGSITLIGGGVGLANRAGISSGGNQNINTSPDVVPGDLVLIGGTSGIGTNDANTNNAAFITANASGKTQTIFARNITLSAGSAGTDTSAHITSPTQRITAAGDVRLTGGSNDGDSNGARIGAPGSAAAGTDLQLAAANVYLTGGTTSSGAALGSSANQTPAQNNNISVTAGGEVILSAGSGNGVRIGSSRENGIAGGDISVKAGGSIALNGGEFAAGIRSAGNVTLEATQGTISETPNGQIEAGSLKTTSGGATTLGGANEVSSFSAASGGELTLVNSGALTLTGVKASKVEITNKDALSASGALIAGDVTVPNEVRSTGMMTIDAAGLLSVVGNAGAPASLISSGGQQIIAASVDVRSNGASATITNNGGDQSITVNAGGTRPGLDVRTLAPGGIAQIANTGTTQTITVNAGDHIDINAGYGSASIQAFGGSQNVSITGGVPGTGVIRLANSTNNTLNSFAGINAAQQTIVASGDVSLTANFATGTSHGVRIGGIGGVSGTDTNLTLTTTGGNVVLSGGVGAANGVGLGSTVAAAHPSTVTVNAPNGNVILNSGVDGGARIGYAPGLPAGGDITINARDVQLNGTTQPTVIRTQGNVTLNLTGSLSEKDNGAIVANRLSLKAGSAALTGPNAIGTLSVPVQGVLPGVLGNFSLKNMGALTITDLRAGGTVDLNNVGVITLEASGTQDARITSFGGQTITADALVVHARDGRVANITNTSGDQTIDIGAGGIELSVVDGAGVAQISSNSPRGSLTAGSQTVKTGGNLNVVGGSAIVASGTFTNSGVFQNQSGKQAVTAANISLQAATTSTAANAGGAFISNNNGGGGDQEVTVAGGTITLAAGSVGRANRAGIVSSGNQTIDGNSDIVVTGGNSGTGTGGEANSAFISANSAGKTQTIHAGNITLNAGSGGVDTSASIGGTKQVIVATGDVRLNGGANSGDSNGARIGGSGGAIHSATDLTLTARDVILTAGTTDSGAALGSPGNTATPLDNNITVNASRDVILNASATNGVRIGTNSEFDTPAGGTINVVAGRDIRLNGDVHAAAIRTTGNATLKAGGAITETGRGFVLAGALTTDSGASTMLGGANQIHAFNAKSGADVLLANTGVLNVSGMSAAGDATLNNIGDLTVSGPWNVTGTSTINVGSNIAINAAMTSASVVLNATTGNITEDPLAGAIIAGSLSTTSAGSTSLTGANQVSSYTASTFGDLAFANASPSLALPSLDTHGGSFSLMQDGDLNFTRSASFDALNVSTTGSMYVRGGAASGGYTDISSRRPMNLSVGKDLEIAGGSGNGAFASLTGYSDINVTVGGDLRIKAGSGADAFARLWTVNRDSTISLSFPNVTSGGYFVNDVEGALRRGHTGILSGQGVAVPDHTLFINYGE